MMTCRRGNDVMSNDNDTRQAINDDHNKNFLRRQYINEDRQLGT